MSPWCHFVGWADCCLDSCILQHVTFDTETPYRPRLRQRGHSTLLSIPINSRSDIVSYFNPADALDFKNGHTRTISTPVPFSILTPVPALDPAPRPALNSDIATITVPVFSITYFTNTCDDTNTTFEGFKFDLNIKIVLQSNDNPRAQDSHGEGSGARTCARYGGPPRSPGTLLTTPWSIKKRVQITRPMHA
ncbi:hypothetical protein EVAR_34027_1 [Eumeta japonica]|uniref:Uncharacterized protein n=1 Tax=Eumeta variegata TaxID=151549 RepID=A0A4C1VUQ7_EUMVA|nr:hypothetical protein EVAR_34027_1 [Eumeta japonica]